MSLTTFERHVGDLNWPARSESGFQARRSADAAVPMRKLTLDLEQFKHAGKRVVQLPEEWKSGELIIPYTAARK